MGRADTITKKYMRKNEVFADAFNFLIYGGEDVVDLRFYKNWIPQKLLCRLV